MAARRVPYSGRAMAPLTAMSSSRAGRIDPGLCASPPPGMVLRRGTVAHLADGVRAKRPGSSQSAGADANRILDGEHSAHPRSRVQLDGWFAFTGRRRIEAGARRGFFGRCVGAIQIRSDDRDARPAARRRKLLHRLRTRGVAVRLHHHGLQDLEKHIDRSSNRVALALVTLGLYIASSLLMQHSVGPQIWSMPVLAILGYGLALWFTLRLVRGISASGRL